MTPYTGRTITVSQGQRRILLRLVREEMKRLREVQERREGLLETDPIMETREMVAELETALA